VDARNEPEPPERLIRELAGAGEIADEGSFTLDPAAAVAKLARFAYADRSRYLVVIVEGLVGLGAAAIEIETVSEDLVIRVGTLLLDQPETLLANLYAHAFGARPGAGMRGLGRLAIGVDMVLGVDVGTQVRLRYRTAATSFEVELGRRAPPVLRPMPAASEPHALELRLDHPWTRRFTDDLAAPLEHLRAAVRYSPLEIRFEGELISGRARDWFETLQDAGAGFQIRAGLAQGEDRAAVIELWHGGVCVERVAGEGFGFQAVIELDEVRWDLSQVKLVRDRPLAEALARTAGLRQQALRQLVDADRRWTSTTRPSAWSVLDVDEVLGRRTVVRRAGHLPRRLDALVDDLRHPATELFAVFTAWAVMGLVVNLGLMVTPGLRDAKTLAIVITSATVIATNVALAYLLQRRAKRALEIRDHGVRTTARVVKVTKTGRYRGSRTRRVALVEVQWRFRDRQGVMHRGRSSLRSEAEAARAVADGVIVIYYSLARPSESWWEADVGERAGPG
jgi:hypothetical protein